MKTNAVDDKELLERIRINDSGAFRQLFDQYWQLLYRLAAKKTGDEQQAEDMVQELFIEIWHKKEPLILTTSLRSYLVSCMYLKIFNYFRQMGFRQKHYADFARFVMQTDATFETTGFNTSAFEAEYGKLQDIIAQTVTLMPPQMQTIFALKHYQGQSISAIAAQLDISTETVKTHLKIAMSRLRKAGQQYSSGIVLLPAFLIMLESSY